MIPLYFPAVVRCMRRIITVVTRSGIEADERKTGPCNPVSWFSGVVGLRTTNPPGFMRTADWTADCGFLLPMYAFSLQGIYIVQPIQSRTGQEDNAS